MNFLITLDGVGPVNGIDATLGLENVVDFGTGDNPGADVWVNSYNMQFGDFLADILPIAGNIVGGALGAIFGNGSGILSDDGIASFGNRHGSEGGRSILRILVCLTETPVDSLPEP